MSTPRPETLEHPSVQPQSDKPEILIVDDSKVIRRAAVKMLGAEYIVHEAEDGEQGWEKICSTRALSLVFTDMQMPNMNGLQLLDRIRSSDDEHIQNLAVIVLTGAEDSEEAKREVHEHGATDFIGKPFDSLDLVSRARSYARLVQQVQQLTQQIGVDKLTGLRDAEAWREQGEKALSFASRHSMSLSVALLEIDDFQPLALQHGKAVMQQIIIAIAGKLQQNLRSEDAAARVGIAKYALLLPLTRHATAEAAVQRIQQLVAKLVFDTGTEKICVQLAAGVVTVDAAAETDFNEILQQADVAVQQALADSGDKRVSIDHSAVHEQVLSDQALQQAIGQILRGEYEQISPALRQQIMQRLQAFIDFAGKPAVVDREG